MVASSATEHGFRQVPVRLSGPKKYQVRSCAFPHMMPLLLFANMK